MDDAGGRGKGVQGGGTLELESTDRAGPPAAAVAPVPASRPAGERIGRYEIGAELGAGGMGIVYAAVDTVLGRRVALKLVRPGSGGDGAVRLLREAQSLARLSHPNVVSVFDVGTAGADVYIAMELIEGQSLGAWSRAARPAPARVLEAMRAAGRGLVAAHAAGIVHRDFKPDNVLVGKDGTVRVTDFGLARTAEVVDAAAAGDAPAVPLVLSVDLTRTGAVMGTPAYMAPEQIDGGVATAASDQFSYCVTLFELLFGVRPFAGDSVGALRAAMAAQAIAAHAPVKLPARVEAAIRRGLREAPAGRHPSMQALLHELRPPAGPGRWWALASAAGAAIAAGAIAQGPIRTPDDPCATGPAELAAVWAPDARTAAVTRIASLGPYGRTLAPRLDEQLRDHAARWAAGHREACVASWRGTQSAALLDRRMACLARGRAALAEVAAIVEAADAKALPEVALAARAIPDPAACADLDALLADVAPPPPPLAARAAELRDQLDRARVQLVAGRLTAAQTVARGVAGQARALGYQPLLAEALLVEGHAGLMMQRPPEAIPPLSEAISIAFAVGADAIGIEAWARRAWIQSSDTGSPTALAGLDVVEAMAKRRPEARFARALLYNNIGAIESNTRRDRAAAMFERALAESRAVVGPGAIELLVIRINLALMIDDPVRRDAVFAEVDGEQSRLLGADHPHALWTRLQRAAMMMQTPAASDLLAATCELSRLHDAAALAAQCWSELGFIAGELHDHARAVAAMRRAATTGAAAEPWIAPYLALWQGDVPGAISQFTAALTAYPPPRPDEPWWEQLIRAQLELGLGRARRTSGDLRGARQSLATSVASLTAIARSQPRVPIERRLARARAELAMTLAASGGDPAEVAALAGAARAWLVRASAPRDELERLERLAAAR